MAQASTQAIPDYDFVNVNRGIPTTGSAGSFLTSTSYGSIAGLRTALSGFDSFTYTTDVLNKMTVNDMVFAWRNIQDPTTIASYMTAQVARSS